MWPAGVDVRASWTVFAITLLLWACAAPIGAAEDAGQEARRPSAHSATPERARWWSGWRSASRPRPACT